MFHTNRTNFFCKVLLVSVSIVSGVAADSTNTPLIRVYADVSTNRAVCISLSNNTTNTLLLLRIPESGTFCNFEYESDSGKIQEWHHSDEPFFICDFSPPASYAFLDPLHVQKNGMRVGCGHSDFSFWIPLPKDFKKLRWLEVGPQVMPVSKLPSCKTRSDIEAVIVQKGTIYRAEIENAELSKTGDANTLQKPTTGDENHDKE